MLKNAPPGTELILSAISLLTSLFLVFGLMYSWLVLDSNRITMVFAGTVLFIILMLTAYLLRRRKDEEDDNEEDESSISLDPDEPIED